MHRSRDLVTCLRVEAERYPVNGSDRYLKAHIAARWRGQDYRKDFYIPYTEGLPAACFEIEKAARQLGHYEPPKENHGNHQT